MAKRRNNKKLSLPALIIFLIVLVISGIFEITGTWDKLNTEVVGEQTQNGLPEENQPLLGTVTFIDVGQGDCTLFISDGKSMLIDSGEHENSDTVLATLSENGIKELDYLVATHAHSDHIGAMADILESVPAAKVIISEPSEDSASTYTYTNFIDAVFECEAEIIKAKNGYEFTVGKAKCRILSPFNVYSSNENNNSVVMHISIGETSFMMTGDAESGVEKTILENYSDIGATILKAGHHGSDSSSTKSFVDAVNPEAVIIHVGKDNKYGHPSDEVLDRLMKHTESIFTTENYGDITVLCFDNGYTIKPER